jgi:NAD(P)-dependent dehydrogenase (short-subunit alcohol dehydrogenase family)
MKTHLIIGASSGIGFALANKLLQAGDNVINISRSAAAITHPNFTQHIADVSSDLPELQSSINSIIYCPGSINLKPLRSLQTQDFLSDFEINVIGAVKCIQSYLNNLKQCEGLGNILLFSTVAVKMGLPFHASVAASKGAIEGLTKSLSAELAPKIKVNAIAPSLTDTPLAEKLLNTEDKRKASADRHPLKSIGEAGMIADAAMMLLNNNFITGTILAIDGGMSSVK